jgi:hypothetical protein
VHKEIKIEIEIETETETENDIKEIDYDIGIKQINKLYKKIRKKSFMF